jgi:hypothetical protein
VDITPPEPAGLDNDDVQDLEYGFAYTEASHEAARVASFYLTLIVSGVPPKHAYGLTSQWLGEPANG